MSVHLSQEQSCVGNQLLQSGCVPKSVLLSLPASNHNLQNLNSAFSFSYFRNYEHYSQSKSDRGSFFSFQFLKSSATSDFLDITRLHSPIIFLLHLHFLMMHLHCHASSHIHQSQFTTSAEASIFSDNLLSKEHASSSKLSPSLHLKHPGCIFPKFFPSSH